MLKRITFAISLILGLLLQNPMLRGQNPSICHDGFGGYWVLNGARTSRISGDGVTLCTFSNILLGTPTSLDATDPFRVVLFYQATQQIQVISNECTPLGKPLTLNNIDVGDYVLACRSARGGCWLFDTRSSELRLTNSQFTSIEQRISVRAPGVSLNPSVLLEHNSTVYLGLNNQRIERFDTYGETLDPLYIVFDSQFWVDSKNIWVPYNLIMEKRPLASPYQVVDTFAYEGPFLPIVTDGRVMCFDGLRLLPCKKTD